MNVENVVLNVHSKANKMQNGKLHSMGEECR